VNRDQTGAMDKRVEIWRAPAEDGPGGRRIGALAKIATVWASAVPDRGTTAMEGERPVDRADLVVTMRNLGAVKKLTVEDRLVIAGDTYMLRTIELPNRLTGRRRCYAVREGR
jgi:Phage head-tail joining protein